MRSHGNIAAIKMVSDSKDPNCLLLPGEVSFFQCLEESYPSGSTKVVYE